MKTLEIVQLLLAISTILNDVARNTSGILMTIKKAQEEGRDLSVDERNTLDMQLQNAHDEFKLALAQARQKVLEGGQ